MVPGLVGADVVVGVVGRRIGGGVGRGFGVVPRVPLDGKRRFVPVESEEVGVARWRVIGAVAVEKS